MTYPHIKSVVVERLIKAKGKIYKIITASDSKSYVSYMNKLLDQYSNTYHGSIGKKPINADYFALTKDIESIHKAPKFKSGDRASITNYKNIFNKGYTENWSGEIFAINSILETSPLTYKTKNLNGEKNNRQFL